LKYGVLESCLNSMAKLHHILGMNARNLHYLNLNSHKSREIADSKLLTKKVLKKYNIPHPKLIKTLRTFNDIRNFDWISLNDGFVVKPSEGYGGEGILVIKKATDQPGKWMLMNGKFVNEEDLKLHAMDIIEGSYSRNRSPDQAFIEQRVKIHPKFGKYAYQGTPDIRIIVYNSVPVMAELRLPTKESNGKANLHQGAVGLGVDMATGITTHGVHFDSIITHIPGTGKKVNGLIIPCWTQILKIAIDCQRATGLGYIGVDVVIDEEKGPLVLELNDQPGLQIQIANQAGLVDRLRRIEELDIRDSNKGIQIAEVLFAENFSDKVKAERGRKIVGIFEEIQIKGGDNNKHNVIAKMDTGAYSVSVDRSLAQELGLLSKSNILYEEIFQSSLGKETRPVIEVELWLQGQKIKALANISNRSHLRSQILIGRKYLQDFMVDPSRV